MEKSEVDALLDGFLPAENSETPEEPPVPPEPPVEEPPASVEPLPDDSPEEPPPEEVTPPSPPQDPSTSETHAPVAPSEDPRDTQIRQMQETISALQQTIETVAEQTLTSAPVQNAPAVTEHKFIEKEEDLDKALNSIDNFNAMLSSVVAKAEEIILEKAHMLAMSSAHQVYTQRTAVNEFYTMNPDLAANKSFVGIVANELASTHPDWDMIKIIENLGAEVRGRLKMSGVQSPLPPQAPVPDTSESPAFVNGPNARPKGSGGGMTKIEKEVNDLISD